MNLLRHRSPSLNKVARIIGEPCLQQILAGSLGHRVPVPIAGTPFVAMDGLVLPILAGGGFTSLDDLINEATNGGKKQEMMFSKTGSLATSGANGSLWNVGQLPLAGGAPAAIPGGAVPTNGLAGSMQQSDPAGGDTLHIINLLAQASAAPNTLLLYDRLWHAGSVDHTVNTGQAVSGSPNRYTGAASKGNFAFLEVTTQLGATAQNLTMTYVDDAGNSAEAATALAMIASSVVTRIPHAQHFIPLNAGDLGLRNITQLQFSAANSAGVSNIVIGRPLVWVPLPVANSGVIIDLINTAFSMPEVKTGACLAFLELKGVATGTTYTGNITMVSG